MSNQLVQILQLLICGPIFAFLIALDRHVFKGSWRNPFLKIPRSVNEMYAHPHDFFDLLVEHAGDKIGVKPGDNVQFVSLQHCGGADEEPDKEVTRATVSWRKAGLETSKTESVDIFVKIPTARGYSVLFKMLISCFSSCTKEVQFYNTVWPKLNAIYRDLHRLSGSGAPENILKEDMFAVPHHLFAVWSRAFERSVICSRCVDMTVYHSRPDWKDCDDCPQVVPLMIDAISKLHGATMNMGRANRRNPAANRALRELHVELFHQEVAGGVLWLDNILKLYLPAQPPAVQQVWDLIKARAASEPCVVAHGDYRMGNMLFTKKGLDKLIVTDVEANAVTMFMWDPSYCMFCSQSVKMRREREQELVAHYVKRVREQYVAAYYGDANKLSADAVEEMNSDAMLNKHLTFENAMDMYRVSQMCLQYFAWVLKQFGGVGQSQGNSKSDMSAWAGKVEWALKDCLALGDEVVARKILRGTDSKAVDAVRRFRELYFEGKALDK